MASALSKHEKVAEILKCGNDPVYFINKYIKIQHPIRGRIQFETYDFQDDVVRDLQEHRFNIVLKSRQLGLSTIAAAYSVWYAIFHKDKNILVIATKLETAINFIKKVKTALQALPPWLLLPKFNENKTEVNFNNGSQIKAVPTSDDAGRSEALSLLIVDEAAFIRNFEDIWTGLSPTISTGGRALILSTPNGVGGTYYRLWVDGVAGQNGFNTISLPWWVHPEHDDAWFKKETRNLTRKKISQEYLCDFLASGDTFLQPDNLDWLKENVQEPIEKIGFDRNIWVWKHPDPGSRYVISADIARGDAADFSAFHIINADTSVVEVEYMGKAPPEMMGALIDEWGRKYNDALAIPENNTFGYSTCVYLRDTAAYPRLYYSKNKGDPFKYTQVVSNQLPGFSTQAGSRVNILTKFEELVRNKQLHIYSSRLVTQLQAFVWQGTKPTALKDSHDDLIISLAIGAWIVGGAGKLDSKGHDHAIAMMGSFSVNRRDQTTLPHDEVRPLTKAQVTGMLPSNVYKPRASSEVNQKLPNIHDFSWLLS